ncbi:hypothetical protein GCM10028801_30400 [Nocardioides maradonensis]
MEIGGKILIPIDETTSVDPNLIAAITCEAFPGGGHVTRIYLKASNEPIRVSLTLQEVLDKINEGFAGARRYSSSTIAASPGTSFTINASGHGGGGGGTGGSAGTNSAATSSSAAARALLADRFKERKSKP